ncbi:hypothetical protein KIW84_014413 [Lathyrus oleraceus]|uniref:Uncharacterized protein n=1 Tax=Pisum sativum TaxID=3888 RepID=A0A9D5GZ68_PEA|nr:hypothetical protein KIW84_014413 [Pisum sativum]
MYEKGMSKRTWVSSNNNTEDDTIMYLDPKPMKMIVPMIFQQKNQRMRLPKGKPYLKKEQDVRRHVETPDDQLVEPDVKTSVSTSSEPQVGHPIDSGTNTATRASFGDSFRVDMIHKKENNNTDVWIASYQRREKIDPDVGLLLRARHGHNSLESIRLALRNHNCADDTTEILVDITRVDDGLQGGIRGIKSPGASSTFVNYDEQDFSIETIIISCDDSNRDGFFILQMKKMNYSDLAFKVAMAHYYVTKNVGLYVEATVCRHKYRGFVVEVNGPFIYQSVSLRKIIHEIRLTGIWSPGRKPSAEETTGDSGSSLHGGDNLVVGQIVKNGSNKGMINANGYTNGALNNSIICSIM